MLEFRSPVAGLFDISVNLSRVYSNSQGNGYYIYLQKNSQIIATAFNSINTTLQGIQLNQGDSLFLRIYNNGEHSWDRSSINTLTLTTEIPEPTSFALVGLVLSLVYWQKIRS